jgi:hypothetical protein
MYKYDIDIKNFKKYFVRKIYNELNFKLNIRNMTTSITALLKNTYINMNKTCKCLCDMPVGTFHDCNCNIAARLGHLDCLKYLHKNGYPWNNDTCNEAAANGHLDCLKYAHKHGCEWYYDTTYEAVANGHLDCLKYAHENGCRWGR